MTIAIPRSSATLLAAVLALGTVAWSPNANDAHTVYRVETGQLYYGWAISELADADGDGVTDWVSGSILEDGFSGAMEVRSGATGALLHRREGNPSSLLGYAMADVGDLDGDGTHDVAVGAPGNGVPGYVEFVSGATGEVLRRLDGSDDADFFGAAVGDAGDVDDDGVPDVLVGAPDTAQGGTTYVVSGATGATVRTYHAPEAGAAFGTGTDAAGDVDGDGQVDHIIGAADAGVDDAGAAYVHSGADGILLHVFTAAAGGQQFGHFFVAGLGDVDGDGVSDLYVGDYADDTDGENAGSASVFSGADGSLLHRFSGRPGDGMGPGRGAGDVDGDGLVDLIVGSYTASAAAPGAGAVTLFDGDSGTELLTITSQREGEGLRFDAVGLGDATGDHKVDLLVSAGNAGTVYLYRGTGVRRTPH